VFVNLINLCKDICGYCTYKKEPSEDGVSMLMPKEVLSIVGLGKKYQCTEALFVTGEKPESKYQAAREWLDTLGYSSTIDYICDISSITLNKTGLLPHTNAGNLTKKDIVQLKKTNVSLGLMLESSSPRLALKGMPHEFAPSKNPKARIKTLENAGELKIPITTGLLVGIGEEQDELVDSLFTLKDIQERYGVIQEIIIQNFAPKNFTNMKDSPAANITYFLNCVSLARIIMPDMNIQVPPNLNYSIMEKCIDAGINDWGGISPLTIDYVNPEFPWPGIELIKNVTKSKGYTLRPRLPVYPEYISSRYIDNELMDYVQPLIDDTGLVKEKDNNGF
jgi:FO synthase